MLIIRDNIYHIVFESCNHAQFSVECRAGKYKTSNMENCLQCAGNYISPAGASSCSPCGDGKVDNGDQTKCGRCLLQPVCLVNKEKLLLALLRYNLLIF